MSERCGEKWRPKAPNGEHPEHSCHAFPGHKCRHYCLCGSATPVNRGSRRAGLSVLERLHEKIEPEPMTGCWLWTGAVCSSGYGTIDIGQTTRLAHRVSYELHRGPIPDGLTTDHLCRVRACVNPAHMEAVTVRENTVRGIEARRAGR